MEAITRPQWRGHPECLRERDSCGQHGPESGAVDGYADDVGAGDCEGEEGEGGALGGEGEEPEEDWVYAGLKEVERGAEAGQRT